MNDAYLLVSVSGEKTSMFVSPDIKQIKQELQNKYDEYAEIHKYIDGKWYMSIQLNIPTSKQGGYEERKKELLNTMDWFERM